MSDESNKTSAVQSAIVMIEPIAARSHLSLGQ